MRRWFVLLILGVALALVHAGCEREEPTSSPISSPATPPTPPALPPPREHVVLQVKGFGEIRFELLAEKAPKTVENFKKLAREGFYAGTTFHRIVPGYVIQGGDPNSRNRDPRDDGWGGPGYTIPAEFNDTPHRRGVVSMARGSSPDSAGSQFFIVLQDTLDLDGQYTAFARVTSGIEVVDSIAAVLRDEFGRSGPIDRPLENLMIESVRIEPAVLTANPPVQSDR